MNCPEHGVTLVINVTIRHFFPFGTPSPFTLPPLSSSLVLVLTPVLRALGFALNVLDVLQALTRKTGPLS